MIRKLLSIAAAVAATFAFCAPASATINPVITQIRSVGFGDPGAGRTVVGTITFGSSDTYVAGGFTVTPQQLGFANQITAMTFQQNYANFSFVSTPSGTGNVSRTIQITAPASGSSVVAATATTATVTVPTLFSTSPPFATGAQIYCALDDNAAGGGSGTWTTTYSVSSCKWVSATTFTVTTTGAAPTGGGNFIWYLPSVFTEFTAGSPMSTFSTTFVATGN